MRAFISIEYENENNLYINKKFIKKAHFDIKNKHDIIHYLGIDDNEKLFDELKDELKQVITFSKKHNLDYCLLDDFESGYFKNCKLIKKFDKLCCIQENIIKSYKQIIEYKNCIGIAIRRKNGFEYQPTNDLGFYFEIKNLDSDIVDRNECAKIMIDNNYYIYLIDDDFDFQYCDFKNLDELLAYIESEEN